MTPSRYTWAPPWASLPRIGPGCATAMPEPEQRSLCAIGHWACAVLLVERGAQGSLPPIDPYRPLLTPCMLTCHSHSSVAPLQRLPLHEGQRQRARLSLVQKAIRFNAKRLPLSNALAACRPTSAKCACKARDLRHAPLRDQPLIMLAKEQLIGWLRTHAVYLKCLSMPNTPRRDV